MAAGTIRREKGRREYLDPEYVDCGLKRRWKWVRGNAIVAASLPTDRG